MEHYIKAKQLCIFLGLSIIGNEAVDNFRKGYMDKECMDLPDGMKQATLDTVGKSSALVLKGEKYHPSNNSIMCRWNINSSFVGNVLINIRSVNFLSNQCIIGNIMIVPTNMDPARSAGVTSTSICGNVQFNRSTNIIYPSPVTLELYSNFTASSRHETSFELLILSFKNAPCGQDLDFPCQNGICISSGLFCDGYDHCGDNSDESNSNITHSFGECEHGNIGWTSLIIAIVVSSIAAIIGFMTGITYIHKKRATRMKEVTAPQDSPSATGPIKIPSDDIPSETKRVSTENDSAGVGGDSNS